MEGLRVIDCDEHEFRLLKYLMNNYDPSVRPAIHYSKALSVNFSLSLHHIIDVVSYITSLKQSFCTEQITFVSFVINPLLEKWCWGSWILCTRVYFNRSRCCHLQDEKNQILTTSCWLTQMWLDNHLQWNETEFGGIKVIRLPHHRVWRPDIILYNKYFWNKYVHNILLLSLLFI